MDNTQPNGATLMAPFYRMEQLTIRYTKCEAHQSGHLWWKGDTFTRRTGVTELLSPGQYVPVWSGNWANTSCPGDDVMDVDIQYIQYWLNKDRTPTVESGDQDSWNRALMTLDSNAVCDSIDMVDEQLTSVRLADDVLVRSTLRTMHPSVTAGGFNVTDNTAGGHRPVDVVNRVTVRDLARNVAVWMNAKPIARSMGDADPRETPLPVMFVVHEGGKHRRTNAVSGDLEEGTLVPLMIALQNRKAKYEDEDEWKLRENALAGEARQLIEEYLLRVTGKRVNLHKQVVGVTWSVDVGFTPAQMPGNTGTVATSHIPPVYVSKFDTPGVYVDRKDSVTPLPALFAKARWMLSEAAPL